MNFAENGDGIARHRNDRRLFHHILMECVDWVGFGRFRCRNVETHLNQTDWRIVILMKLQCDFILAGLTLRHMLQWNLETGFSLAIQTEYRAIEVNGAPIPAAQRHFLLEHVLLIVFLEEIGQFAFVARLETQETYQRTSFGENANTECSNQFVKVDQVDVGAAQLIDFAGLTVFEYDGLVGQFQSARRLQINYISNCEIMTFRRQETRTAACLGHKQQRLCCIFNFLPCVHGSPIECPNIRERPSFIAKLPIFTKRTTHFFRI